MSRIERAREFYETSTVNYDGLSGWMAAFAEDELNRDDWTPINSVDDLPKVSGKYWWTLKPDFVVDNPVQLASFWPGDNVTWPVDVFLAWMPYEEPTPYKPEDK